MTIPLDALRRAVALAHAVPGAELRVACGSGSDVVASHVPPHDVSLCQMRRVVLAGLQPELTDCSQWIEAVWIGGTLAPVGGGVYRRLTKGTEERWLVTLLTAREVSEVIDVHIGNDDLAISLHPDHLLGSSVVRVRSSLDATAVDTIAMRMDAQLMVGELQRAAASVYRQAGAPVWSQPMAAPTVSPTTSVTPHAMAAHES